MNAKGFDCLEPDFNIKDKEIYRLEEENGALKAELAGYKQFLQNIEDELVRAKSTKDFCKWLAEALGVKI